MGELGRKWNKTYFVWKLLKKSLGCRCLVDLNPQIITEQHFTSGFTLVAKGQAWSSSLHAGNIINWFKPDLAASACCYCERGSLPCQFKDAPSKEENFWSKSVSNQGNSWMLSAIFPRHYILLNQNIT